MATAPDLTPEQIADAFPAMRNPLYLGRGGQKIVFSVELNQQRYALKLAALPGDLDADETQFSDIAARASREVEIMRDCTSPYMVKLGPVGLQFIEIAGQKLLYFTEELIEGDSLQSVLQARGALDPATVIRLGVQMTKAIADLWSLGKIHRDIKPGNIMQRTSADFVLLDAGLAFDVVGESLSAGFIVGTLPYFSPEQFDYTSRRVLDFRSDLFSLGVTLYEAATGTHPFWTRGEDSRSLFNKITAFNPPAPSTVNPAIPKELDRVILRMLGKSPHLRYRKTDQLVAAFEALERF
jgi:eukaryotic-like serine/threonine-protein kinase